MLGYGLVLALGLTALALAAWAQLQPGPAHDLALALPAFAFTGLGLWLGLVVLRPPPPAPGNPPAVASLQLSPRELAVLAGLAEGLANKDIARRLEVSPNTVKTHMARLFAKLEAGNRTAAVARARALGILP
jgi:DNA-binding CsgD family transcriptional regulator